jgi:hypothetical protein
VGAEVDDRVADAVPVAHPGLEEHVQATEERIEGRVAHVDERTTHRP